VKAQVYGTRGVIAVERILADDSDHPNVRDELAKLSA
jgi:hypothetical protein